MSSIVSQSRRVARKVRSLLNDGAAAASPEANQELVLRNEELEVEVARLQAELADSNAETGVDVRFYYSPDEDGEREAMLQSVVAAMRDRDIRVFLGGERETSRRRINVLQPDVRACFEVAAEVLGAERVRLMHQKRWQSIVPGGVLDLALGGSTAVDAVLLDDGFLADDAPMAGGQVLATGLRLEVIAWSAFTGAYESTYLESNRPGTVAKRLRPKSFDKLAAAHHDMAGDIATADAPDFPVDIVYTWVDGDDPEWLAKKVETQAARGIESGANRVVNDERFRNRDELKYSLRSVEEFAPWVRKIHIVTAGQRPDWLNVDHPKIELVDHEDIFLKPEWLPTFNSSGIETQLHHVPDLAEKFLYFNDDFFLGEPCTKSDFFFGNGAIKYFPSSQMSYEFDIDETSEEYIQADKNAVKLISQKFGSINRDIMQHVPYPSDRTLLEEIEQTFADEFAASASEPFRSTNDLRPIAFMQYHYGFHAAKAMPSTIGHRYLALWKHAIFEQLDGLLHSSKKTFCINDVGLQPERTLQVNDAVIDFLEAHYPRPSAFEK